MPRALTEQEKCNQCQNLLEKGKTAVFAYGIKKVSVDDITKAAGMAKGSFYHHFESKEQYLLALVENIYRHTFIQAEQIISGYKDIKSNAHNFFERLFGIPEITFFIKNERDIIMLYESIPNHEMKSFKQMEVGLFERILRLAGADTKKIKPGVVHNYVHTLFLINGSDLMIEDNLKETIDLITDSLVSYIFGGAV